MYIIDKLKRKFAGASYSPEDLALVKDSILFDAQFYSEQVGPTKLEPLEHYLSEGARQGKRPHPLFDEQYYRTSNSLPETQSGLAHFLSVGLKANNNPHPLFDSAYYLAQYPDVVTAGLNPFWHYLTGGYKEFRNPHPLFNSKFYTEKLATTADLDDCGGNALIHYVKRGSSLKMAPHVLFDGEYFLKRSKLEVDAGATALEKYLSADPGNRQFAHPLFDSAYYHDKYPDTVGSDALLHYLQHGYKENRSSGLLFDSAYYVQAYPDCAGENPLLHFLQFNSQGNPNKLFDSAYYSRKYSVPKNPFLHYLKTGATQNYQPAQWFDPTFYKKRYRIVSPEYGALMEHYLSQGDDVVPHPRLLKTEKTSTKQDILVYSIVPWHSRVQRPQQLVKGWTEAGHRVFYIDREWKHSRPGPGFSFDFVDENVCVIQLHVSNPTVNLDLELPNEKQLEALTESLARVKEAFRMENTLAVIQYPSWKTLAEKFSADYIVFDCMDHVAGFDVGEAIIEAENELVESADLMIVTSAGLKENFESKRRDLEIVRNAADVEFFGKEPANVHSRPGVTIGYYGAISQWFDVDLVCYLAEKRPEWNFTLIGQVSCDVSRLEALKNVQLLGEMEYSRLPEYLYGFNICMIPFLLNELTRCTNPVKVYEYLAAGKPVVCTAMPELQLLDRFVAIGSSPEDFLKKIELSLNGNNLNAATARRDFVKNETWKNRAIQMIEVAERSKRMLPIVSVVVLSYNNIELTKVCLNSLLRYSSYPCLEIIVVDNASTDGTPEYLTDFGRNNLGTRIILNRDNSGFAAGNNLGIKQATGEIVVLLNNDTFVTDGWVLSLLRHFRADAELGLLGPVTNNIGNEAKIDIAYESKDEIAAKALAYTSAHARERLYVDNIAFFCVAISREAVTKVGTLDERFGLGFFEDDDYCKRARNEGFKIAIAEDCFIHHELSASWNANKQKERDEYLERNKILFEAKWGEEWKPHTYRKRGG